MFDRKRLTKDRMDPEVVRIFSAMDAGKLKHNLSPFFTRPLYQHTSAEVGGITCDTEHTTN